MSTKSSMKSINELSDRKNEWRMFDRVILCAWGTPFAAGGREGESGSSSAMEALPEVIEEA
eukprot:gene12330-8818_t